MMRFKVFLLFLSFVMPAVKGQGGESLVSLVQRGSGSSGARLYTNESLEEMHALVTVSSTQQEAVGGAIGTELYSEREREDLENALRQAAINLALSENRIQLLQVETAALSDLYYSEYDGATQLYYLSLLESEASEVQKSQGQVRWAEDRLRSLIRQARRAGFYPGQIRRLTRAAERVVQLQADPTDEIF